MALLYLDDMDDRMMNDDNMFLNNLGNVVHKEQWLALALSAFAYAFSAMVSVWSHASS